jgi:hypothetical protein
MSTSVMLFKKLTKMQYRQRLPQRPAQQRVQHAAQQDSPHSKLSLPMRLPPVEVGTTRMEHLRLYG